MSKYDKEREAMGITPVASSSTGKSKYDEERNTYRRGDENKQYANAMKSAFESNPDSFKSTSTMDINDELSAKAREIPVIGSILKGLDAFATNPIVDKGAEIARSFYIPGAGLSNLSGLTGAAEVGVSKLLPSLGNSLGGRVAQRALSEAIVGAPLGAAQTQMLSPDASVGELATGTALGSAFGGGLGAIGKFAGSKISAAMERRSASRYPFEDVPALPSVQGDTPALGNHSPIPDYANTSPLKQEAPLVAESKYAPEREQILKETTEPIQQADDVAEDVLKHTEPRVRDKVVNFFDEAEQAARDRLKAKRNTLSSNPIDQYADYAIIGASKLVKGTVKFADWSAEMIKDFGVEIKPHLKDIFKKSKENIKEAESQASGVAHLPGVNSGIDPLKGHTGDIAALEKAIENSAAWKDKNRLLLNRETTERNFESVMGKDAPIMNKTYIEPIKKDAADRQRFITQERNDIKGLGIKYKSAEDALVQNYGESKMTLDELKAASPDNWQKVKTAAETMRAKYDKLLDMANVVLKRNGYPEIPKRKDYFPHYEEMDGILAKLGFGFEDNTLPAEMNGITANLKPGKNWFSHFQKRKGEETTLGAMAGFDRYIEGISKVIHQTDNIKRLRGLDKTLRATHEGTTHLSDFLGNLTDYTNILAGKKSELDRSLEAGLGRNAYSAIDWMKRRVGANMIGGSVSSALTNSIPVTQLLAETNKASVLKGLNSALQNLKGNDMIGQESNFLARRFPSDKLAMGKLDKAQNVAGALFKGIDHFTSNMVVRSKYYEGLKKGMTSEEAMKAADQYASRMMAERSEGSMPALFSSRAFGVLTQFQLEVNNQISHLFKDMPKSMNKKKYASTLAQVFIYDFIYNELYEKITGNRPAFDPIGVIKNAVEDYSNPRLGNQATKNLIRNASNSLPFASVITGGGRVPLGAAIPDVLGVVKGEAKLGEELLKPVKNLALPFGGSQINKTITGLNAAIDGGISSTNAAGEDALKYPIAKNTANLVQGALFGKNALPETRDYYRNNTPSLTPNETKMLDNSPNKEQMYKDILIRKQINSLKDKMTKISKDKSLSDKERTKEIGSLNDQYKKLTGVR